MTAGLFDDDPGLACFVECVDKVVTDDVLHQFQGKPAADDRGCGKRLIRFRGEPGKSAAHGFSYALWQGALVPHTAAFVDVAQGLDEEEGVTARDSSQCVGKLFVVVAGLGDVCGHVVLAEAAETDAVGRAQTGAAVQVGEHRRQGVGAVQVGAAVRADDLHARVLAEAQQMPQQQQRRLGRPVQVVEYQDDRRARGGDFQERDDGVEKCVAFGVGVGASRGSQIRQDVGQPGNQCK